VHRRSWRTLDHEIAWLEASVGDRLFDHVAGDAVFDAAHGVEKLDLGEDLAVEIVHRRTEPHHRRPADGLGNAIEYAEIIHRRGL